METFSHKLFDESTGVWNRIMDQLSELREWQRMQEEVVRERQLKQIDSLTQQNSKLNALKNSVSTNDNHINGTDVETVFSQCQQNVNKQTDCSFFDDSIEEFRTEDNDCHQINANQSSNNILYSENSPVVPGIDGKNVKTFEELLNIRLNNNNSESVKTNDNKPKKPFLRKGEGIKRFEANKHKPDFVVTDGQKNVCFKTNQTKDVSEKPKVNPKPRYSPKDFLNKRKLTKSEPNLEKPKQFIRKVVPLTTKFGKIDEKSIEISRNTPTVVLNGFNESETELFEYLQQMYENVMIEDNSIDEKLKNKDINELQDLLNKIEVKREIIQKQFNRNVDPFDGNGFQSELLGKSEQRLSKSNTNCKKKVHWSHIHSIGDEQFTSDQQIDTNLSEPKPGPYSLKLKQQIDELEDQLSRLKNFEKMKNTDKAVAKTSESSEPVCEELIELRQQIEKLNKRIVNIEAKAYDLSSSQQKVAKNRKENVKCFVQKNCKTPLKTILSPMSGPNVSVNDVSNETTIDFPNGDKMTVSKDNTILYRFANGTTQTTFPDGLKITNFPNGQTEKMDKNGVKHITYANGLQRIINVDSSEEVVMTDGTIWRIHSDGSEILEFPNGDREIRTNKYKRREYRNGNIKTVYSDGTEETRYINGRLRIKDRFGNLIVDSMVKHLDQHL